MNKSKQILSIALALIVSVILSGYDIIPHHHHGDAPCFSVEHSSTNHPNAEQESCELEHHTLVSTTTSGASHPIHHFLQAIFITVLYSLSIPDSDTPVREYPHTVPIHSTFVARACGLRAPPALS
jgi:hypothetical protein